MINFLTDSGKTVLARAIQATASVILILWLGHSAAQLTWLFVPTPELLQPEPTAAINAASGSYAMRQNQTASLALLARLPFVSSGSHAKVISDSGSAIVDTSLKLVLRGAIPASNQAASRAIIAEGDRQSVVVPGQLLPISTSGVSLAEVRSDRVVLDNNGRHETLWLDQQASTNAGSTVNVASRPTADRHQISGDTPVHMEGMPPMLAEAASVTLHRTNEGVMGMKLKARGDGRLFRRLGFRNDDIAIAIDDIPLTEAGNMKALAVALQAGNKPRLKILRNGEVLTLQPDLSLFDLSHN